MPLHFNKGVMDRNTAGAAAALLDRDYDVIWMRYDKGPKGKTAQWFENIQADGQDFKISSVGQALPLMTRNEDTEGMPIVSAAPGYAKEFTLYPFRMKVVITENLLAAQRFARVQQMAAGLVPAGEWTQEYMRVNVFNNAFSGTAGADSLSLCNDSHPHENPEAGTWDNLGTGPLTVGNWHALRLLGQLMTDEQGRAMPVDIQAIYAHPNNEQKAREIMDAKFNPENALNQPNVLPFKSIVIDPNLTSTTAHFGIGNLTGEARGLLDITLISLNVKDCRPSDNPDIVWAKRAKFFKATGFTQSKNVFGSAGT